jgi:uncharacterized protein YggU (UPF0235/DUF167 family)
VQPGARRTAIESVAEGELRVRLSTRPVEGAANAALLRLLADSLRVPRSRVSLLRGGTSRSKTVLIATDDPQALLQRLWSIARGDNW